MTGRECPNCGREGTSQLAAAESGGDFSEWRCHNENCRVAMYYVNPELTERGALPTTGSDRDA